MILADVNLFVYAYRDDVPEFPAASAWLTEHMNDSVPLAIADIVISGFIRVVTNRRAFAQPTPLEAALSIVHEIRSHRRTLHIEPDARQWGIFVDLCRSSGATGKLVPDAYIASLAIANGCELATNDRDFRRFRGLRTFNPLEG